MTHQILLFTFKEGLLSRVAHDLRLHVEHFTITRDDEHITARIEPASLVVDGVMHGARLDPDGLGPRDRSKITQTIRTDILRTRQHPNIEFRGRLELPELSGRDRPREQSSGRPGPAEPLRCVGELWLMGVRRPLTILARREGTRVRASFDVQPSDFGIAPYKALAGAIRLQDRARVELDLDGQLLGL